AYGLSFLLEVHDAAKIEKLKKVLLYSTGGLAALLIVVFLFKSSVYQTLSGSWFMRDDENYGEQTQQVVAALKPLRFDVLWKDYIKFVLIVGAAAVTIVAFLSKKIRAGTFCTALIAILIVDLVIVDSKFINPKPSQRLEESFQPDATIAFLKQQPGLFRVFPLGNLFMDNTFAYHGITSVGGYSPAKLKIYQTMLDSCMYKGPDPSFPLNMNMVNMLNVKYLILEGQLPEGRFQLAHSDAAGRRFTYLNPSALPRAFFVNDVRVEQNQTEVFSILNSSQFNAGTMAVIEKPLPQEATKPDSASAEVTDFKSRSITVKAYTSSPALLVLSEVYYPAGWRAFIDGNETEIFKTNYILRSVAVPAGNHDITFTFDPPMYNIGWNLSHAGWGVAALCILIGLWKTPAIRARLAGRKPEQAAPAHG
ncbi:MAG: hypothetical protein HW412_611, partial [Bacteroidetes bacterium]|nr:hypothetical protein [Bacteroidota bacterium]